MRRYAPLKPSRGTAVPKPTRPVRMCPVCGERPVGSGRTCGRKCGYEMRKAQVRPRPCRQCGVMFRPYLSALIRGARFCSKACYNASIAPRLAMIEVACLNCGTTFKRTQAAVRRVKASFCGNECKVAYLVGEHHQSWRGGSNPNRGQGWRKLAEQIRERDGYRCRRCGITQEDAGQRLSVDHIIPWRAFDSEEEANRPENLVALCRPCHSRKARAERLWLKGDVLDMWSYQIAVAQPWGSCGHVDPVFGCCERMYV